MPESANSVRSDIVPAWETSFLHCHAVFFQYWVQCTCTAAVDPCNRNVVPFCFLDRSVYHFVWYRVGKQDQKIRATDFFSYWTMLFCKDFCFAAMAFADVSVLTDHSFVSSNNHYTHVLILSIFLKIIRCQGQKPEATTCLYRIGFMTSLPRCFLRLP